MKLFESIFALHLQFVHSVSNEIHIGHLGESVPGTMMYKLVLSKTSADFWVSSIAVAA